MKGPLPHDLAPPIESREQMTTTTLTASWHWKPDDVDDSDFSLEATEPTTSARQWQGFSDSERHVSAAEIQAEDSSVNRAGVP